MKKIVLGFKKTILDKRSLTFFYIAILLYNNLIITLFNWGIAYQIGNDFLVYGSLAWMLILIIDDIVNKRVFDSKFKILFGVYYAYTTIVFLLNRPYNLFGIKNNINFLMMWCIVMCVPLYCSNEEFKSFISFIGKQIIIVVNLLNLISIIVFLLVRTGILSGMPGMFYYHPGEHLKNSVFGAILGGRYAGLYPYLGFPGLYSCLAILMGLYMYENQKIKKWHLIFTVALGVIMMVLSNGRTAELMAVFIALVYVYRKIKADRIKRIYVFAIIVFIITGILFLMVHYDVIHMSAEEAYQFFDRLSAGRFWYWSHGIRAFMKRKWFGYGLGNLIELEEKRHNYHNIVVSILVWSGIVGLLLSVCILFVIGIHIYKNWQLIIDNKSVWLLVLMISVLLESLLEPCIAGEYYHLETPVFWLCLGCMCYLKPASVTNNSVIE